MEQSELWKLSPGRRVTHRGVEYRVVCTVPATRVCVVTPGPVVGREWAEITPQTCSKWETEGEEEQRARQEAALAYFCDETT